MEAVAKIEKPDYGLDAPGMVKGIAALGTIALVIGFGVRLPESLWWLFGLFIALRWCGIFCAIEAGLMLYSSYAGKLRERDRLIESIPWRGDEQVLDAGCGRGLLLIAAAKRLTSGKAVGIDSWRSSDLTDNWAEATLDNARLEGVGDRVEVHTGDAREMPFENESFDVVLSSLALHNIPKAPERSRAIEEIARVLKPGGCVVILDLIGTTGQYGSVMKDAGLRDVTYSGLRFRIFPPARILRAKK